MSHVKDSQNSFVVEKGELNIEGPRCCWYFKPSYNRFIAGFMILTGVFVHEALLDIPGPLESVIKETFMIQQYQFGYLYSVYSLPNIICCLFNGILVDRILGLRLGAIIFAFVVLLGQIVFTIGGFLKNFWILVLGRFIFGLGNDSLLVVLSCYLTLWFKSHELNFAYSIFTCTVQLSSSSVYLFTLPLYEYCYRLSNDLSFGFSLILFCLFAGGQVILVFVLAYYSRINGKHYTPDRVNPVRLIEIIKLPFTYWLISLPFALCASSVFTFVSLSQQFFQSKYNLKPYEANGLSSFFNLISGLSPLVLGFLVDITGKDLYYHMIGMLLGMFSFLILSFTNWSPFAPLSLYAICYALLTICSWTIISLAVKNFQLATAFALVIWMNKVFGLIFPMLAIYLSERFSTYGIPTLFLFCFLLGSIGTLASIIIDKRSDGILNMSAEKRKCISLNPW